MSEPEGPDRTLPWWRRPPRPAAGRPTDDAPQPGFTGEETMPAPTTSRPPQSPRPAPAPPHAHNPPTPKYPAPQPQRAYQPPDAPPASRGMLTPSYPRRLPNYPAAQAYPPATRHAVQRPQPGPCPPPFPDPNRYRPPGFPGQPLPRRRRRLRHSLLIGGVPAAVVVAVGLPVGVRLALSEGKQLDVQTAQAGVQQILADPIKGYGAKNVTDVRCNNGRNPIAKQGSSFTCEVNIDGTPRTVTVVFQDDNGTYEVDRPS